MRHVFFQRPRLRQNLGRSLIIVGCVLLVFVLSGCSYPGEASMCGTHAAECDGPDGALKNYAVGGAWYLDWFFDIINKIMANIAQQAVEIGVNLF